MFKAVLGLFPEEAIREKSGIRVVQTRYQHTDMSYHGPENAKTTILGLLAKFLDDESALTPIKMPCRK